MFPYFPVFKYLENSCHALTTRPLEIRLILPVPSFDVVSFDEDKFVDFPKFCSFISPDH